MSEIIPDENLPIYLQNYIVNVFWNEESYNEKENNPVGKPITFCCGNSSYAQYNGGILFSVSR